MGYPSWSNALHVSWGQTQRPDVLRAGISQGAISTRSWATAECRTEARTADSPAVEYVADNAVGAARVSQSGRPYGALSVFVQCSWSQHAAKAFMCSSWLLWCLRRA